LAVALLFVVVPGAIAASLRAAPAKAVAPATDEAQVVQLRAKLTKVSGGFTKLLSGPMAQTHVGFLMSKVNKELQHALTDTKNQKDSKKAIKELQEANAAVKQMSTDMANEQMRLMHEGEDQEMSLLLGVLMQRQKEPMAKQMEVMTSAEFAKLPAVIAVLAAKDTKTPLFQQIATYADAHARPKEVEPQMPENLKKGKDGKPDVTPIVLALQSRLKKMQDSEDRMEEHNQREMTALNKMALDKKNNTAAVHQIKRMQKRDNRDFKKRAAVAKHDIAVLSQAIESVKKGDMAGLAKAQNALTASMKAAQARGGKFLYLIQLVHRAENQDCPFCVAQCVDKCHNAEGKPYVACLTVCADAGK
jgi:uncharacterized protein